MDRSQRASHRTRRKGHDQAAQSRTDVDHDRAHLHPSLLSEEQAREGVSLDAQLTECRRYAAQHGWMLGPEFQDVLSGKRDDRPAYQALLAEVRRLRAEGQSVVVVVFRLDRLGRRILERVRCREELKSARGAGA